MYPINSSLEQFMQEYGIPEGVAVTHIPHDGSPFSAYTILSRGDKTLEVQFGVGGYYADVAAQYIKDYFNGQQLTKPQAQLLEEVVKGQAVRAASLRQQSTSVSADTILNAWCENLTKYGLLMRAERHAGRPLKSGRPRPILRALTNKDL